MEIIMRIFKNNWFIALSIALLIILVLGIPFTEWGFKTDDWANILHSKLTGFADLKNLFTEGNMESINHPSGSGPDRGSFLQGLYRPMSFVYYWPQTLFFGTQAYGYFLVTIILHALNAGLFFLILRSFFGIAASLLAALFFGFHPSLQNWLGWISAQTYFIELFFLGLIFICFYRWLQNSCHPAPSSGSGRPGIQSTSNRIGWYLGAVLLFFLNLLLKEASIILCAWTFLATLVYADKITRSSILLACKASAGFILAALGYCLIRLNCMPFVASNTTTLGFTLSWHSFITKQISRTMQFLTYLYDILGLTWLPKGHRLANGCLLLFVLIVLGVLFFKSRHKKIILFCLTSTIMFSWPGLLMHYQPRYMYMGLPWMIVALVLLLKSLLSFETPLCGSSGRAVTIIKTSANSPLTLRKLVRAVSKGLALLCIAALASYIFANMKERAYALHWLDDSMRTLVAQDLPAAGWQRQPLCFFGLPTHWFDMGTAQAVWFLDNAQVEDYPVYQQGPALRMPHQDHARAIPCSDKTEVMQKIHADNMMIELSNTQELELFNCEKKNTTSVDIAHFNNNVWFITWDYAHAKFKILGQR